MIYFFLKDRRFLQCEVHPGRPHLFRMIEAEGVEHTEEYWSTVELGARCDSLCRGLIKQGWSGPFGRDSRV